MKILQREIPAYQKAFARFANNKWLQHKHVKHSYIDVAHYQSTVAQSTNNYHCNICNRAAARYSIVNKRKLANKDTNVRFCGDCKDSVLHIFPAKLDYCK
jgi:hypothetical protein